MARRPAWHEYAVKRAANPSGALVRQAGKRWGSRLFRPRHPVSAFRAGEDALAAIHGRSTDLCPHMIGQRSGRLPVRLPHFLKTAKPATRRVLLFWRWGESNPRPRARTVDIYRFIRSFKLSGKGWRNGTLSIPYPGFSPCDSPDPVASKPRFVVSLAAAQGGATADPSLTALTRRERNCHCCWQVNFCRIRRSAAPPAAHDPDRPGRDRCTPFGRLPIEWITASSIYAAFPLGVKAKGGVRWIGA